MPGIDVGAAGVGVNPQNIKDSDAYKFLLEQGGQAVDRSAAAKGTLLTGGTLKDLAQFGQGLASQEYGNEFQRQFGLAELNAGISSGNAGRNLSGLGMLYSGGLNAAGGMAGAYGNQGQSAAGGTRAGQSAINQGLETAGGVLGDYFNQSRQRQALQTQLPNPGRVNPSGILTG